MAAVRHGHWRLLGAILLAGAASGASVALMGVSGWLISRAAEAPPVLYLQAAAVGVRFFGISRGFFRYLERLVGHDLALRMQAALRVRTYDTLARTTLIGRRRGDLLARVISDVQAIQDLVVRVVIPFCSASLVVVGTTVMLARFSPGSAAVLLLSCLLAGVLAPLLTQRASLRHDSAAVPARGALASEVLELARAGQDLVANGAADDRIARALAHDEDLRRIESRAAWVRGLATGGQVLASGVAVIAALWIGGHAVAAGTMGPRLLAVVALTPLAMHEVLSTFTQAAQTFTRSQIALSRLAQTLDEPPVGSGDARREASADPGLRLSSVTAGWPGGAPVVRDLDLSVAPGERVALVGRSGIGKTTVAATVMGMIPALDGEAVSAGRVGYLAQNAHIFRTTVSENVRIGDRQATDAQVRDALARAGLDLDPERVIGEAGATLSGGEARRLALARLLVGTHDLWILDEPTEHLDHETAAALMTDVWASAGDSPVLVITHDADVMAACSRVVRLG
ncbi:thiol reductant ABC exporter subunit CydC [Aestuariimicrobium soli]|uniref:thiol reductant ABC exporter subunit CydC n=1 Tax=Aestuariimicrobium soli TaxID=2035834 RepID=UPI003EBB619A